eukprot:11208067-Lingulodinium_polyedra.AAC.1
MLPRSGSATMSVAVSCGTSVPSVRQLVSGRIVAKCRCVASFALSLSEATMAAARPSPCCAPLALRAVAHSHLPGVAR